MKTFSGPSNKKTTDFLKESLQDHHVYLRFFKKFLRLPKIFFQGTPDHN